MSKVFGIILSIILVLIIGTACFFNFTPIGKTIINSWKHSIQVADDESNYETLKEVEDSCRAMIASYNADKLTYEQYKDSENEEKQSWAEQAKIRANKTASSYNNYIIKNSYVWKNNIPADIKNVLEYIN